MLAPQNHADPAAIRPGHVDDVGHLAGPVDEAAEDVDAEIKGSEKGAGHHRHSLIEPDRTRPTGSGPSDISVSFRTVHFHYLLFLFISYLFLADNQL